jgi:hypothetical protein
MKQTIKRYLISSFVTVLTAELIYLGDALSTGQDVVLDKIFAYGLAAAGIRGFVKWLTELNIDVWILKKR